MVTPVGLIGVGELSTGNRKRPHHYPITTRDNEHRGSTEQHTHCGAQRPRRGKEVAGKDEAPEPNDAAKRQRADLERFQGRAENWAV